MKFSQFLKYIDKKGWGVSICNTYYTLHKPHIFLEISEKGKSGKFFRAEGEISKADDILQQLFSELKKHCKLTPKPEVD